MLSYCENRTIQSILHLLVCCLLMGAYTYGAVDKMGPCYNSCIKLFYLFVRMFFFKFTRPLLPEINAVMLLLMMKYEPVGLYKYSYSALYPTTIYKSIQELIRR